MRRSRRIVAALAVPFGLVMIVELTGNVLGPRIRVPADAIHSGLGAPLLLWFASVGLLSLMLLAPTLLREHARSHREAVHRIDGRPMTRNLGEALGLRVDLAEGVARGLVRGFGVILEPSAQGMRFCVRGLPAGLSLAAPSVAGGARTGDAVLDGLVRLHGNTASWRARLDVAARMVLVRVLLGRRGLTVWDGVLQWVSPGPIGSVEEGQAVVGELVDLVARLQLADGADVAAKLREVSGTDPSPGVRIACIEELAATVRTSEERLAVWTSASRDRDASVRLAAIPLAPSGADAEELLIGIAESGDDAAVMRALALLVKYGTVRTVQALGRLGERGSGPRARAALEVSRGIQERLGAETRGQLSTPEIASGALSESPARAGQVSIAAPQKARS